MATAKEQAAQRVEYLKNVLDYSNVPDETSIPLSEEDLKQWESFIDIMNDEPNDEEEFDEDLHNYQ